MSDSTPVRQELDQLREEELVLFIRDTVTRLNLLGDRLEDFANAKPLPQVGFEVLPPEQSDGHDQQSAEQQP